MRIVVDREAILVTAGDLVVVLEDHGLLVKVRPSGWRAQCPLHPGKRSKLPLAISEGRDGRRLLFCHRCGAECFDRIRDALGLPIEAFRGWANYRNLSSGGTPGFDPRTPHSPGVTNSGDLLRLHAAGELTPEPVSILLPKRAGRVVRVVVADVELLLGLRRARGDRRRTFPYAPGWVADRLGEDKRNVARAIRWLVDHGVLERRGKLTDCDARMYRVKEAAR